MSSINCNVSNCAHNNQATCYASKISINGKRSRTSTHTCCSSFVDTGSNSSLTSSIESNSPCSFVGCNVKTCTYNAGTVCSLSNIGVNTNNQNPNAQSETYCSSFRCK